MSRYDIRVEPDGYGGWSAYEDQRFDAELVYGEYPDGGYVANYAHANGDTKWEAIRNLIDSLEEHDDG